jgi:hypothetical protein
MSENYNELIGPDGYLLPARERQEEIERRAMKAALQLVFEVRAMSEPARPRRRVKYY